MGESILNGKAILAVDDESDVLDLLEEEILLTSPNCRFDRATTYEVAANKMNSQTYDLVILDIMGVRGFDLLALAVSKKFKAAMLTAHALSPEALKRSIELGAMAYLPKEKLGELVPYLEDIFQFEYLPSWKRLLNKLEGFFNERWGKFWQKSEEKFWKEFNEKSAHIKW